MSLWSCKTCSKSFSRKGDLTRHELLHTGIKPHVCETCGKAFAQFSGLKTHRNIHSNSRPFICGLGTCKKAFGDPSSRIRHRKEYHSLGPAYKCFIADCTTSIKRRSTFMTHLRKHGVDTSSSHVQGLIEQMSRRRTASKIHSPSPDTENGRHDQADSWGTSFSILGDSSGCKTMGNSGETSHLMSDSGLPDDGPFDWRRANWSTANDGFLPDLTRNLDQIAVEPSVSAQDSYHYLFGNLENPSCFDDIFLPKVDHSLLTASPLNVPVLEPFLETGSDGFYSSSSSLLSSPASTYSVLDLNPIDFNDDMGSQALGNSVLQKSRSY